MDEKRATRSLGSASSTKKPIIQSSAWNPMQRAINILLQYASTLEGLFTIPVPNEVAVAAWKSISTDKGEAQADFMEMDLHVLGAGLLLHLRELNGSLLTTELHDRFVAAAAISSRYSQIYIFRLLLGELPSTNHAILRDLALLLRCTALKNNSNVTKKIIMCFGKLLLKKRDSKAIVHRQLTSLEAGMLFTMVLMEEWTYLFQYGQVSFHTSIAKGSKIPRSPSGSDRFAKQFKTHVL
ncbi:unnamed protein product [Calypogeia fissa]